MKKILSLVFMVAAMMYATSANAQIKFGLKGGLNVTSMSFSEDVFDASNKTGFFVGPMVKVTVPIVGLSFDAAALYDQKEADVKYTGTEGELGKVNVKHIFKTDQRDLLRQKHIFTHRSSNLMNTGDGADHGIRRVAEQGGDGVVFFQQLAGGETRRQRVIAAGRRVFIAPDQPVLRHRAAKTEQALLADKAAFTSANVGNIAMAALDKITHRQICRLTVIAHHQIAFFIQQRLRNHHQRQRAAANLLRQGGGAGIRGQIDNPGDALLLKRQQAALKMVMVVLGLAEKNHIPLFFQLLNNARHHLDGKAVAEIAQDQANQIGGVGAKVGSGNVMHIAQRIDGSIDLPDRCL